MFQEKPLVRDNLRHTTLLLVGVDEEEVFCFSRALLLESLEQNERVKKLKKFIPHCRQCVTDSLCYLSTTEKFRTLLTCEQLERVNEVRNFLERQDFKQEKVHDDLFSKLQESLKLVKVEKRILYFAKNIQKIFVEDYVPSIEDVYHLYGTCIQDEVVSTSQFMISLPSGTLRLLLSGGFRPTSHELSAIENNKWTGYIPLFDGMIHVDDGSKFYKKEYTKEVSLIIKSLKAFCFYEDRNSMNYIPHLHLFQSLFTSANSGKGTSRHRDDEDLHSFLSEQTLLFPNFRQNYLSVNGNSIKHLLETILSFFSNIHDHFIELLTTLKTFGTIKNHSG